MKKLAVFASGSGTNYQVIAEAIQRGELAGAEMKLLVTNKPEAYVVKRARRLGTPVLALNPREFPSQQAYEEKILERLIEEQIDLIILAGYMRLIGSVILKPFAGKIINLHPSLLPAFPGLDAIGQAMDYGVKVTGVTVHFVDEGLDTGPIIAQEPVEIREGEAKESVTRRIHEIEHRLLPQVIGWLIEERLSVTERKVAKITDKS